MWRRILTLNNIAVRGKYIMKNDNAYLRMCAYQTLDFHVDLDMSQDTTRGLNFIAKQINIIFQRPSLRYTGMFKEDNQLSLETRLVYCMT
jgi:hypothetical protein